ncbi:hypothetical protein EJB05_06157 [Eragrostis curvula]|uniref:Uncharacterized protein n=1 Tax=Eragrostis curvula TaxID=38414 RepID=A0A5J9WD40_9POAL|nr:hypothetical protein EJB05_06157 [Eragrostis curvula]
MTSFLSTVSLRTISLLNQPISTPRAVMLWPSTKYLSSPSSSSQPRRRLPCLFTLGPASKYFLDASVPLPGLVLILLPITLRKNCQRQN